MRQRCRNKNNINYKNYGGRGIDICEDWDNPINFFSWSDKNGWIEGVNLSIDRIDNDKGYSPENCRWTDRVTQQHNRRASILNTSGVIGVSEHKYKNKPWLANLQYDGEIVLAEFFSTKEEAVKARMMAEINVFGNVIQDSLKEIFEEYKRGGLK